MDKKYKITFLDKGRYKGARFTIFLGIALEVGAISFIIYFYLNGMPIKYFYLFSLAIGTIAVISMLIKYNKYDLTYFIIDNNSVYYRTFFGRKIKEIYWKDVQEAGISRFSFYGDIIQTIYVSKKPLTRKDKYKFMKYGAGLTDDILLIKYTEEAYNAIKEFYGGKILINTDEDD